MDTAFPQSILWPHAGSLDGTPCLTTFVSEALQSECTFLTFFFFEIIWFLVPRFNVNYRMRGFLCTRGKDIGTSVGTAWTLEGTWVILPST